MKQVDVSSYSDLSKISSNVNSVHLRKFVSKRLINQILEHKQVTEISFSKYAYSRLKEESMQILKTAGISVKVYSERGRPNFLKSKRR